MRWLPRLSWNRWTACDDDVDFEGFDVELHWLDLLVQFGVGRRERRTVTPPARFEPGTHEPTAIEFVPLAACPIGLFLTQDGTLGFKSEYSNNEGRIDAFCVDSGEFFWGAAPQTIASQRATLVTPHAIDLVRR